MTIEEKAKAYDEALERVKAYHRNELAGSRKEMMEYIFPQLLESEDERIRKALVWHLKADVDFVSNGVTKVECISYLEKQKEQKPISFSEPYNPHDYEVIMEENATSLKRKEMKPVVMDFIGFLDKNRRECKMCLSNGECEDIEKAFREQDWEKLGRYIRKYIGSEEND